jgi:uncharacterized membrane protein
MRRPLDQFDLMHIALAIFQAAAAAYVAKVGPDGLLPMHFDLGGEVDRWGSRFEAVWMLAAFAPLTLLIGTVLGSRQAKIKDAGGQRTLFAGRLITVVVLTAGTTLMLALGLGLVQPGAGQRAALTPVLCGLWVIFIILGGIMGKAAPNPWMGVRTRWTRHSRLAWDKANRLMGRILFLGGIAGLLLVPVLDRVANIALFFLVVLGGGIWAVLESWRAWRTDPERTA